MLRQHFCRDPGVTLYLYDIVIESMSFLNINDHIVFGLVQITLIYQDCIYLKIYPLAVLKQDRTRRVYKSPFCCLHFNPHTNMRGPHGPRKTLIAAQTIIIPEIEQAQTDPSCAQLSYDTSNLSGSVRTPHNVSFFLYSYEG